MPDYKIGSHVRVSENGVDRIGTVIGYKHGNVVLIEDDILRDIDMLLPYVWEVIPNENLTIIPLGDDNS